MNNTQLADITVHINEKLDESELNQLEYRLRQGNGIASIGRQRRRPHLMIVGYDPKSTKSQKILEHINRHGLKAQLIGL